ARDRHSSCRLTNPNARQEDEGQQERRDDVDVGQPEGDGAERAITHRASPSFTAARLRDRFLASAIIRSICSSSASDGRRDWSARATYSPRAPSKTWSRKQPARLRNVLSRWATA